MDSVTLQTARNTLGKICAAAVHGRKAVEITRYGTDPVVVISKEEYQRLRDAAVYGEMVRATGRMKKRDFTGYTKVTREELAEEDFFA
jgi:prevent-host-death family protein